MTKQHQQQQQQLHQPSHHRHHNNRRNRNHHRHHQTKRPDAIVFPPNPNESGPDVVNRIYEAFGLSDHFPKDCQQFVNELLEKDPSTVGSLADYTDKPFITIDNDNSMDLDQAMWITPTNDTEVPTSPTSSLNDSNNFKYYVVSYAIADAAYFVPALSPIFQFALTKGGTSFYLPGKSIPMLPRQLSEDMMSLNANVKRRALIFDMYLDSKTGSVVTTKFCWGIIQSRWKGTYREVDEYYDALDTIDNKDQRENDKKHMFMEENCEFRETLDLLRTVGILRRDLAADRNVVDYNRDGSSFVTMSDDGKKLVFSKAGRSRYITERYNEQISLLCNSEGAKILNQMDLLEEESGDENPDIIHPIFRTQSGPREEQIEVLEAVITNTLKAHGLDDKKWSWKKEMPIATYLTNLRRHRQEVLSNSENTSNQEYQRWSAALSVIERQAMITNVAASFTATPEQGHHSLKMSHYARFSSPMRELVGCFTHKELWEGHTGRFSSMRLNSESDIVLRNKVIRAARRAKAIQKKLSGALYLHMLNVTFYKELQRKLHKRTAYKGILLGMDFSEKRNKSRRCYVKLDDPAIEIKVYGEDLDYHYGCRYRPVGETFGRWGTSVSIAPKTGSFADDADDETPPTFRVGDSVTIRVSDFAQFYGQTSRSRWIFIMDIDDVRQAAQDKSIEKGVPVQMKRTSLLRNSLIDRDLWQDLLDDDESTSSESEQKG